MNPSFFGPRLRELREEKGWTQRTLAEKSGIKQPTIASLEQGRNLPGWDTVLALAGALGVDCLAFLSEPTTEAAAIGRPKKGE